MSEQLKWWQFLRKAKLYKIWTQDKCTCGHARELHRIGEDVESCSRCDCAQFSKARPAALN